MYAVVHRGARREHSRYSLRSHVMDTKRQKDANSSIGTRLFLAGRPPPFDLEREMREEFRRRIEQNRQGNLSDVVAGR